MTSAVRAEPDSPDEPRAQDSQPTPPEDTEGVRSISFRNLSLLEADVNGLLDMMFATETDEPTEFEFPEQVRALAGEQVALVGYMIPLDWVDGEDRVTGFMLVRDLASCCFGGMPRPDEWVDVSLPLGSTAGFFGYVPIRVTGTLSVGLDRQQDSLVASVFQIVAGEVTDEW